MRAATKPKRGGRRLTPPGQLLDDPWNTVSMGISRLTVAASNVASATVATVKPGLQARAAWRRRGAWRVAALC